MRVNKSNFPVLELGIYKMLFCMQIIYITTYIYNVKCQSIKNTLNRCIKQNSQVFILVVISIIN